VQAAIDEALEWWNANAYQDGYVNAANSSYQAATSYSSRQLSMDIGLNYEWASGDVAAQFNYASSSEERVAMMVYKQVFYTITMDPPKSPGSVFGKDVTVSDFQTAVNSDNPPAYVHSVSYGRIIMFRMRTTVEATDIQLSAALDYARGFDKGSLTVEAKSKEILANSSITSITIGGNAEVASQAVTARSFGDLDSIITGKNAVYSRNNPGVPIAYTIRYLKDNSFAKMGYVTEYKIEDCSTSEYEHDKITYTHKHSGEARFRIKYKKNGFAYNSAWIEDIGNNESQQKYPPDGSYDIELEVEYKKWGLFQSYESVYKKTLGYIKSKVCYQGTYNSSKDNLVVYPVTCP
ncbi:MAG: thiol-activated cytolysin family protein, partial [Bacteroidetes bacterium]|nr:thiol-activated cytolysin family protein [Bacteroidota bacterium]